MSRPSERPDRPLEELDPEAFEEELGDDAIIAQQSRAHLPQKRASVHEEARTIVIAEGASSRPPRQLSNKERNALRANTVVVRDRREIEEMQQLRAKYHSQRARGRVLMPFVWAGLALAAFAAGGLVTLLIARGTAAIFPSSQKARSASGAATVASGAATAREEPPTPTLSPE